MGELMRQRIEVIPNVFIVAPSVSSSRTDVLRSRVVRAANGALVCGDTPTIKSIARVTGIAEKVIRMEFDNIDQIIAATPSRIRTR